MPPNFWWQPQVTEAPLPRSQVQPQISPHPAMMMGARWRGVVRNLYLGTLPSLKGLGEAAGEKLEKLGKHHL